MNKNKICNTSRTQRFWIYLKHNHDYFFFALWEPLPVPLSLKYEAILLLTNMVQVTTYFCNLVHERSISRRSGCNRGMIPLCGRFDHASLSGAHKLFVDNPSSQNIYYKNIIILKKETTTRYIVIPWMKTINRIRTIKASCITQPWNITLGVLRCITPVNMPFSQDMILPHTNDRNFCPCAWSKHLHV